MAIKKEDIGTPQTPKIKLEIDNGDLKALNEVMEKWNFLDEKSLLTYAIAMLLKADSQMIILKKNEGLVGFSPSDDLLKPTPPQNAAEKQ